MQLWPTNPYKTTALVRGQGCTVWDQAGKPYLDLLSGCWCNVLGYGHPRLVAAVQSQVNQLTHASKSFPSLELELALDKLSEILPPKLSRAVFLNTGSEAVELALKMAHAATGAPGVVVNDNGYYGATTYAMALSEPGRTATYLPKLGNVHRIPAPDCHHCAASCASGIRGTFPCLNPLTELADSNASLAAVLYSPLLGNGIITPPDGYVHRLRELTTQAKALLIAEEVTTGLGRTGRWFGFMHADIMPDILVIGKAIGAGLPVAAVVTTEEVAERCRGVFGTHVQSHQNDPFSARIAATVIEIMQDEHLVEQAAARGDYFRRGLEQLQSSGVVQVRGRGLMLGAELAPKLVAPLGSAIGAALLPQGFITDFQAATSTFRFFPPYVITTAEIDSFLEAFAGALARLTNLP